MSLHAQGLHSNVATVTLTVIKPDAPTSQPRDLTDALPLEWSDADEIRVQIVAGSADARKPVMSGVFVRDASQRLVAIVPNDVVLVSTRGSTLTVAYRAFVTAGTKVDTVAVRYTARWVNADREERRLALLRFPAP